MNKMPLSAAAQAAARNSFAEYPGKSILAKGAAYRALRREQPNASIDSLTKLAVKVVKSVR